MEASDLVKILGVHRVTPLASSPKSTTESSLALTHFDMICLKFYPVEQIFFYEFNNLTLSFFNSVIIPKLKSSLSLALLHFLPLAGNIKWPSNATKPCILYTVNDGILVRIAESAANFTHLSSNQMKEAIESRLYIPELNISDSTAAIIAIQITLFPYQGFSIGVTVHHAVFDGKSLTLFLKAWAYICKQSEIEKNPTLLPELFPLFDRAVVQDPEGLDMVCLNDWMEAKLPGLNDKARSLKLLPTTTSFSNLTRATFKLSSNDIDKLRQRVVSTLDDDDKLKSRYLSTFVLSFAYTLVCLAKVKMFGKEKEIHIAFSADLRARLDPPVPENYFGNLVIGNVILIEAGPLFEENGINFIVKKLDDKIQGLEKGTLKGAKLANSLKPMELSKLEAIGVAGSPKFKLYDIDFGWGRPKKVEIVSIDRSGVISMVESKDESGGVEIGLVLQKYEMETFDSLFVNGILDL
ncbi:hypothetical protein JCGZ_19951 [Jatropha curcas]|uniref:Uncharacterized protein n=1 Tax=Jatropha curcas TaxID=180498 RepID=A0A067JTR0_JATCU|nr:hypothetical protein JCGZ_19951 [Jatropha curcas]